MNFINPTDSFSHPVMSLGFFFSCVHVICKVFVLLNPCFRSPKWTTLILGVQKDWNLTYNRLLSRVYGLNGYAWIGITAGYGGKNKVWKSPKKSGKFRCLFPGLWTKVTIHYDVLLQQLEKKKQNQTNFWLYFIKINENTSWCYECLNLLDAKSGNTSNLMKHLINRGLNIHRENRFLTFFNFMNVSTTTSTTTIRD